jgi:Na+/H+ antiporter NhaC
LTLYFDNDFLKGVYVTLAATVAIILGLRLLNMNETFDTVIEGFKTMIEPLGVLVAAFIFKDVNDALGLPAYVVQSIEPFLTADLLPTAIFVTMGLVSFATGSNWGVFVIILPIVATLGNNLGADMTLCIGATLSASTFGSHACFYSDSTVLFGPGIGNDDDATRTDADSVCAHRSSNHRGLIPVDRVLLEQLTTRS